MRKVWIGAGSVAGAAALLAAVPYFIDWSWFTPRMIAAVEASTGYDVEAKGDLHFALLPRPSLVVAEVSITGFGAERQPLITAEKLSAAVAFWPLLSNQVEVDYVALETPVVRLVTYADGSNNWSRGDDGSEPTSGELKIANFRIANGTLIKRAPTGSELRFDEIDAKLTVPSLDGPYGVDGTLVWNRLPVALKADYAPTGALRVDADIEGAGTIAFVGRLPAAADATQPVAGTLTVSAPNLDAFLAKLSDDPGVAEPAPAMAAPFTLSARVSGTTEALRLARLSGTIGGSKLGGDLVARFGTVTALHGRLVLDAVDALKWMSEGSGDDEPFELPAGYAADLLVQINRLSYGRAPLGGLNTSLSVADRVLTIGRTAFMLPGGGRGLFQGVVDTPAKVGMRVRGTFVAEMLRPSATLAAFGVSAPIGLPPLSATGPLTMVDNVVTLANVRGRFDNSAYIASARYPLGNGQPIDFSMVADRLNTDRLRGDSMRPVADDEAPPTVRFNIAANRLISNGRAFAGVRGQGLYASNKVTLVSASAQDAFGFAVRGKGTVDDLSGAMDTDLELSLAGADARGTVAVRGPVSRMTVNGTVNYAGAAVGLDGWIKTGPSLSYQIDVDAKATEAARVLGQRQAIGPLALTLRASGADDRATFTGIAGWVGPMQLSGNAVVNTAGARPILTATLKANEVPLDKLWGRSTTGAAAAARNPGARWSREAIDFAWLGGFAGKLTLTAERLTYGAYVLNSPSLIATVNGRQLTLNVFEGELFGGKLAASGELSAAGLPAGNLKLSLAGVPMEPLFQASMASAPASGTLNLTGSFAVRGRSQHEMIDSLAGPVRLAAENGVINKVDLDRLNQQLDGLRTVSSFVQFAGTALKGGQTPYRSLSVELQGRSGRFDIKRVVTDMAGGSADATGSIDLTGWTADVDAVLKLGSHADAPSIPGTIKGPLSKPAVAYNLNPIKLWFGKRLALAGLNAAVKGEGVGLGDLIGIRKPATPGVTPGTPAAGEQAGAALPSEPAPVAEAAPAPRKSVEDELGDVVRQGIGSLFKKKKAESAPAEPAPEVQPPS